MERSEAIRALVRYALDRGLIQPSEEMWAVNALLEALSLDSYTPPEGEPAAEAELPAILDALQTGGYTFVPVGELLLQGETTVDARGRQRPAS